MTHRRRPLIRRRPRRTGMIVMTVAFMLGGAAMSAAAVATLGNFHAPAALGKLTTP